MHKPHPRTPDLGAVSRFVEPVDRFDLDAVRVRRRPHLAGILLPAVIDRGSSTR